MRNRDGPQAASSGCVERQALWSRAGAWLGLQGRVQCLDGNLPSLPCGSSGLGPIAALLLAPHSHSSLMEDNHLKPLARSWEGEKKRVPKSHIELVAAVVP